MASWTARSFPVAHGIRAVMLVATLSAAGCGDGEEGAGPTGPTRPAGVAMLLADCSALDDGLRCAARLIDSAGRTSDVTNAATWSVSTPEAAVVPQAGRVVPVAPADITLTVTYQNLRNGNPVEYRLAPGATPRPLTFLGVSVLDEARAALFRAQVEIVSGTGAGSSCLTNETGYCGVRGVAVGEPLRVRVSAEGYVAAERDHRIDPFPGTPFLTVLLARVPR